MASKAIKYVWKIAKPADPNVAHAWMAAAYQAATQTDPNISTVLVRSPIHSTTWKYGKWTKDRPHITICTKNNIQEQEKTHVAVHAYTESMQDPRLVDARSSYYPKPDNTTDRKGNEIWPEGLPSEVVMFRGPSEAPPEDPSE